MTGNAKVHHKLSAEQVIRLKPHKLGRHYHKIPQYIREVTNKYPRVISDYFLRNYRINLELSKVLVHEQRDSDAECTYRSSLGKVGFSMDRALLTEVLECYYGGICLPNQDNPPVSMSEQRMRSRLGIDVAQILAQALLSGETFGDLQSWDNAYDDTQWEYIAEFQYYSHITHKHSSLFIYMDAQLVDELTTRLVSPAPAPTGISPINQIMQLPVRLNCVVASVQMPLAQVLALRPGDIVAMRMRERCDVEISQQKLFRGFLYEDDGALYLTSLESVKTS
ncbi:MAG TPA: FliM/FliN family flagellar motor switch protein [Dongiaceae bacterium]|nr:FliM/FliN family flagellar motor switch protein [Dongiaceae bacterium]